MLALAGGLAIASGPASAADDSCPNAAIRSQQGATHLPDCRAYEQVSPIDKNNNHAIFGRLDPLSALRATYTTPDGETVTYAARGSYAGALSSQDVNHYAATRGEAGWDTTSLNAPIGPVTTTFARNTQLPSPDLSKELVTSTAALAPGAVEAKDNYYIFDPGDNSYELIAGGVQPPGGLANSAQAVLIGVSPDHTRWWFKTGAVLNATPAPPPGQNNYFYEYSAGEVKFVGVLPDGSAAQGAQPPVASAFPLFSRHMVSADGSQAYWGPSTGQSADQRPLYLYDGGPSTLVTKRETDDSQASANFQYAVADGSRAFLTSNQGLTADASPSGSDLYRYDRDAGADGDLVDLTPTATAAGVDGVLGISEDGSFVYFQATGDLAPGATAGQRNLYVWHDGQVRLIATSATGFTPANFLDDAVVEDYRVSANGRFLGFAIDGALAGPQPQPDRGAAQAYHYDFENDTLTCASCPPAGAPGSGDVTFSGTTTGSTFSSFTDSRNVLDNGTFYFQSPDSLVSGDANGRIDVYQYSSQDDRVQLISNGRSANDSVFADASPDGRNVFFATLSGLVEQDGDSLGDLYDARVDGGIESQNAIPEPQCQGDSCQGEQTDAPDATEPGSKQLDGSGNPPRSCETLKDDVSNLSSEVKRLRSKAESKSKRAHKVNKKAKHVAGKRAKRLHHKAKRLRKQAERLKSKAKDARSKRNEARSDLRDCREGQ